MSKMEQMTIFDVLEEYEDVLQPTKSQKARESQKEVKKVNEEKVSQVFEIGDRVKVKSPENIEEMMSIEDAYVLSAFSGKKGKVVGIHQGKVISYEVQLNTGDVTYFYSRELILLG